MIATPWKFRILIAKSKFIRYAGYWNDSTKDRDSSGNARDVGPAKVDPLPSPVLVHRLR